MTLREAITRLKAISQKNNVDEIKELVEGLGENTVYPANVSPRWREILSQGQVDLDAVAVTFYNADASIMDQLRQRLKKKFQTVGSVQYDTWRVVFVCGKGPDDKNPVIVCSNWYPSSREEIKAQSASGADDPAAKDANIFG